MVPSSLCASLLTRAYSAARIIYLESIPYLCQIVEALFRTENAFAFLARLHALGEAHDLLTIENLDQAPLHEVVGRALKSFEPSRQDRIMVKGPRVALPAKSSLMLTMYLHELATNAAKYGALSNGTGKVNVGWTLLGNGVDRKVKLSWRETGGPPVTVPQRKGFGSLLIEQSFVGYGETSFEFRPDGLKCSLELSLY